MSAKNKVLWGIWIGLVTGIYTVLYLISPLGQYNLMWISFIALPIYFNAGAQRKDYAAYVVSDVVGVVWGLVFLWAIGAAIAANMSPVVATTIVVGAFTGICCIVHFFVPDKGLANKLPAMFGAIAATFSQNGENAVVIAITLVLGSTLALVCQEGTRFLKE